MALIVKRQTSAKEISFSRKITVSLIDFHQPSSLNFALVEFKKINSA